MKNMRRLFSEQRGSVMIYITISMIVLLAFGAGVMDLGVVYENRRQLQNGADGAALAGAQELLRFDLTPAERRDLAINTALDYAQRNDVPVSQMDPGSPQVTCVPFPYNGNCDPSSDSYYNAVKVSAGRNLGLMVAGLLNSKVGDVGATATAIAAPMLPNEGVWPWGVSDCDDWDFDGDVDCGIPQGVPIILKLGSPPGSPGNFFPLDFPDSSGANAYGDSIENGYGHEPDDYLKPSLPWCGEVAAPGCAAQDDPYVQTETGNKVGDTRAGVDYLVDKAASTGQDNPASSWNEPVDQCTWPNAPTSPTQMALPDPPPLALAPYVPPGWTGGADPPPSDWVGNASSCYRIGIVPIIYQTWGSLSGKSPVDIIRWGAFYLIGRTNGPGGRTLVWGYYMDNAKVSGGHFSSVDTGLWSTRLWE